MALLRVESGQDPRVGTHPERVQAAGEGIREAVESNSNTANRLGHAQFRFLVLGAVLYIVWHVVEMHARGTHQVAPA
jgi:hypothetical protein